MDQARVLIADDESAIRENFSEMLRQAGHVTDVAADGDEVLDKVRANPYDLLLVDLVFPPTDGVRVLTEVKQIRPQMLVVVCSGFAEVSSVLASFRRGAFDFVEKPVTAERLAELAGRAVEIRMMGEKRRQIAEELENERMRVLRLEQQLAGQDPFESIVGASPAIARLIETIREVSRTDSTVLLTGESGTGKGLVSRTIHQASSRAGGPFIEANCVVYSEGVLHSELFGHERGAFTGAARTKKGRFELARGGTLFLDEIGEIAAATQLLLLRVLQDRTFERVGGEETMEADVRLIAATNRNLQQAIEQGTFRSDLFYRLNVIPVAMPALRERVEDVPVLAQHFLSACAEKMGREVDGFSPAATDAMCRYGWPGNVRELENLIERVVVLNRTGTVELTDLPPAIRDGLPATLAGATASAGTLQALERQRIVEVLDACGGNKKKAASQLGIHRSTLYAKLRRYGLLGDAADDGNTRHDTADSATLVPSR